MRFPNTIILKKDSADALKPKSRHTISFYAKNTYDTTYIIEFQSFKRKCRNI